MKAARRVRREAVRKRPEFTRGERGTSSGGPPYSSLPTGMAADLLLLHSPPRETRILSAPRPRIPSGPGQRAEALETSPTESSGVPLRPIPPSHLRSLGWLAAWPTALPRMPQARLRRPTLEIRFAVKFSRAIPEIPRGSNKPVGPAMSSHGLLQCQRQPAQLASL